MSSESGWRLSALLLMTWEIKGLSLRIAIKCYKSGKKIYVDESDSAENSCCFIHCSSGSWPSPPFAAPLGPEHKIQTCKSLVNICLCAAYMQGSFSVLEWWHIFSAWFGSRLQILVASTLPQLFACFRLTFTQYSIELGLSQSPHFTSSENQRSIVCTHSSGINQQIVSSFYVYKFYFKPRVKNL